MTWNGPEEEEEKEEEHDDVLPTVFVSNLKKVFVVVVSQYLFTGLITILFLNIQSLRSFLEKAERATWTASAIIYLSTYTVMFYCAAMALFYPVNYILLLLFTLASSFIFALLCIKFKISLKKVLIVGGITSFFCALLGTLAYFLQCNLIYYCTILLAPLSFVLISYSFLHLWLENNIVNLVTCGLSALFISVYFFIDVQTLFKPKYRYIMTQWDFVVVAMVLYVDIMILTQFILYLYNHTLS